MQETNVKAVKKDIPLHCRSRGVSLVWCAGKNDKININY